MTAGAKYKRSRQRDRILDLLRSTDIHPDAGWIYDQLKQEFKDLSMGTVYRNLNILLEQGLVMKLGFGSTFDRFDGNVMPHYHFYCESCKSMLDIPLKFEETLNRKLDETTDFKTRGHRLEFYGLCGRCLTVQ